VVDTTDPQTEVERTTTGGAPRQAVAWVSAVMAAVAGSCLVGIGRRPLWLDESLSVGATTQLVDTWRFTGGTMAAYYAVLTPWIAVSHDRVWIRALSLVFALAVLPVTYWIARQFAGRWEALLATALLGGSWTFTRYAQEARSYALAMLLTTLAWALLVRWVRTPLGTRRATRYQVLYTVLIVAALLAHGLTGLQVLAQIVAVGLLDDRSRRLRALVPSLLACMATLGLLSSVGAAEVANWIPPLSLHQLGEVLEAFTGPHVVVRLLLGAGIVAGATVAVRRFQQDHSHGAWLYGALTAWAFVPPVLLILLSVVRPYLLARYVIGSLPAVAMLLVLSLRTLGDRTTARAALGVVLVVAVVAGRISLHDEPYDDWAGVAQAVAADARHDDLIAFPTQTIRPAFDFAWSEIDAETAPRAISPVGPLGTVHRMYPYHDDPQVPALLAEEAPPRIWVVGDETVGRGDTMTPFLDDVRLGDYEVTLRQNFDGGLAVVLLERT